MTRGYPKWSLRSVKLASSGLNPSLKASGGGKRLGYSEPSLFGFSLLSNGERYRFPVFQKLYHFYHCCAVMMLLATFLVLYFAGFCGIPKSAQNHTTTFSPFELYTLSAENITAIFVPYGARLTSLLIPDRSGNIQDVVLGYDNGAEYLHDTETNHTYFGPVVGRYANRIKNGTFVLNGITYHIPTNENGGLNTLHGGNVGYDQRNWTVVSQSTSSIIFSLLDTGFEGFPGSVLTTATFNVSSEPSGPQGQLRPRLTSSMWNLNAFRASNILNDTTLWMPYSKRYIEIDDIEIPTGAIGLVSDEPSLNFISPKLIGTAISNATGLCGFSCTGIDNAFILDRPPNTGAPASNFPVLSLWSNITGIKMDVSTNQQGLQIYSCNGQNGTIPVKKSQQARNVNITGAATHVNKFGCLVIETQAWIDGINHPEWGIADYEIFSPETGPAVNHATYEFSTFE